MIVLWPRSNQRTLVVVEILVSQVPIKSSINFDRETRFGRLETHGIRVDQRARTAGWIREAVALPVVLVDSVSSVQRQPGKESCRRVDVKEIVPYEI